MISHARFLKLGLDTNLIVATQLLNKYATSQKPDSLSYAHQLFDQIPFKDTVLWTSIISAYSRAGNSDNALQLFSQMHLQTHPIRPNHFVYATAARACGSATAKHLVLGKCIHSLVIKSGFMSNVVVGTAFLDMYAKCGVMDCSCKIFDEMPRRNLISWNALIAGCVLNEKEFHGLKLFYQMKCVEFQVPDEFAVATVLTACAGISDLNFGMQVHAYLVTVGFEVECENAVCNLYFRCREVSCAEKVLKGREDNALSMLLLIRGYLFNGRYENIILYVASNINFIEIVAVDHYVVLSILTACANLSLLRIGRQVHGLTIALLNSNKNFHLEEDAITIGSALIDMYCKCSSVREARRVFDSLRSIQHVSLWNSMITGYMHNVLPEDARGCFEEMPERNVVSWTTMIMGYVRCGLPDDGIRLLAKMYIDEDGVTRQGNCFTFATALEACSHLTAFDLGKQIHAKLIRTVVNADTDNVVVGTALVDMYSKSGDLNYAQKVFNRMVDKNVLSWTSMITGYAIHGLGYGALKIFQQMIDTGIKPTEVTFVCVLTACSHCGLVEEGLQYFKLMKKRYGMVPRSDHYTCLIDLLGRAGRLDEAWNLLEEIEDEDGHDALSGGSIWGALLGACNLHGNVEMGSRVAEKMLEKKQQVSETYIVLSNVYSAAGMWDEAYGVRERWRRQGALVGESGRSRIHS